MALIKNRPPQTKSKLNGKEISSIVYEKIEKYCQWANLKDLGIFFEEAAELVFKSDKDWKKFIKENHSTAQEEPT